MTNQITLEDVWQLFAETDRRLKELGTETDRRLKELSEETRAFSDKVDGDKILG
ncbi:hypothetical protein CCP3SC1AL1_3880001 [Gammaproteobacteria bacterium]